MTDDRKRNKCEELNLLDLKLELMQMQLDWNDDERIREFIPLGWYNMHDTAPCTPPKQKLTVTLDKDVVKFYRSLGRGYQGRMNAILRTYMLGRISKLIEGPLDRTRRGKQL